MDKVISIIGAPCSGKSTQIKSLITENISCISAKMLVIEMNKSNEEYRELTKNGLLIPDIVMNEIVGKKIKSYYSDNTGVLFLDGYPRTMNQHNFLDDLLRKMKIPLSYIYLSVEESELLFRREKRVANENRNNDNVEIFRNRLAQFLSETMPILDSNKFYKIDGQLDSLAIHKQILEILNNSTENDRH